MGGNPKLVVLSEGMRGQQYDLTEMTYEIGRSEQCNVCIPDPTVSGVHCRLHRNEDATYTARDTGSTNGTRINGVRITEQRLFKGDILQIGGVEIAYESEADAAGAGAGSKTQIRLDEKIEKNTALKNLGVFGRKPKPEDDPRMRWFFRIFIAVLVVVVLVLCFVLFRLLSHG